MDAPPTVEANRTRLQPDDLVISITAELGMVAVVPNDLGPAHVSQHVAIARLKAGLDSQFLAAFIATPSGGQTQLGLLQRGATKIGLGLDDIATLAVPLPPLAEQREIGRRVGHWLQDATRMAALLTECEGKVDAASQALVASVFRATARPTTG